jgi:hypothetical protein
MSEFQKKQRCLAIVIVIAIVGGLALGILWESDRAVVEKTLFEKTVGILAFFVVLVPLVLYWIIPNTSWGKKRLKLKESMYISSFFMGLLLGLFGLVATIKDPQIVMRSHLFELLFALLGMNYIFLAMAMKDKKTTDIAKILDEKQIRNLVESAAGTFTLVTGIMIVMYFLSYNREFIIEGKIWFLIYFFLSTVIFSSFNIHFFNNN